MAARSKMGGHFRLISLSAFLEVASEASCSLPGAGRFVMRLDRGLCEMSALTDLKVLKNYFPFPIIFTLTHPSSDLPRTSKSSRP